MKTKTKKLKDLDPKEQQYICHQSYDGTCKTCPLYIDKEQMKGCYMILKYRIDKKGEQTITL